MSDRERWLEEDDLPESFADRTGTAEAAAQVTSRQQLEGNSADDSRDPTRTIEAATELVAVRQELDLVRRMLAEKERLVDATEAQCRRLEDALEDQHVLHDELKQDLERKKQSLSLAREQVARISAERQDIQEHYEALLATEHRGEKSQNPADRSRSRLASSAARFIGSFGLGVFLTIAGLGAWMQLRTPSFPSAHSPAEQEAPPPTAPARVAAPSESGTADSSYSEVNRSPVADKPQKPPVPQTHRDRLLDGSAGPLMVLLQGGDFTMGRALPNTSESPAHSVHLESFLIGATEVTFEQYDRFALATGRRSPSDFGWGRGNRPVVDVSWDDARSYALWLSQATGYKYRLPSESEWEYAAAAGQRSLFWWGSYPGQGRAPCLTCGTIWDARSSAPVGSFKPNPFGLYDTAGNVMEWVEDCYHPNYIDAPSDGQPRKLASCRTRVARSGAFNKPAQSLHTTARQSYAPDTRINALGFRVVRDLD